MKIIFLNKYQFAVNRGAETFVFELAKRLSQNHEVLIISQINYLRLLKLDYNVIIPTNGRLQVFIVRIISWLKGAKMIISGQSGAGFDDRLNLYSFPDVFVGLTNYQSKWAKKINKFVHVTTIPNGVDLDKFKDFPKSKHPKTILSVGAFTKDKRHELTIKAVSRLKNVNLIIAGGGGDREEEIRNFGIKILGSRFRIVSQKHEQMPNLYNMADVLAFPTVPWESFGIVLLEAMASGIPVVATNDPIRKEIVAQAGILVDPLNTKAFAQALKVAMSKKWGKILRLRAEQYSWDGIANKYEEVFKKITQN